MNQQTPSDNNTPSSAASWIYTLTPRERKVLELSLLELTCKEIAQRMGVAEGTVRKHRKRIARKMGVTGKKALQAELNKLRF